MPMYLYECQECQEQFDAMARIADRENPQECPECGATDSKKVLTSANLNFPGDDWASKNGRVRKQMAEKNKKLAKKEEELKRSGKIPKLAPNVGGECVDSWGEAAKLAKSKGKNTAGYERQARKEKATA